MIYCFNIYGNVIEKYADSVVFSGTTPINIVTKNSDVKFVLFVTMQHDKNIGILFNKLKRKDIIFINHRFICVSSDNIKRIRNYRFKTFKELSTFLKKFCTYTDVENSSVELNEINEDLKIINFFGITNTLGMPNRGPIIQTNFKKKYFKRDIKAYNIVFNSDIQYYDWAHILNPTVINKQGTNISIGPNIFLKKDLPVWCRDKHVVADSEWMKSHLIEKYDINSNLIDVIPVYVAEEFYTTMPEQRDEFTVGVVGYYQDNDIKNFSSLPKICSHFPDIRFEIMSSRNKNQFPDFLQNIPNLHFLNIPHENIHEYMKYWDCYLGLSKRERGPAVVQELRVVGIPTICANHTGYKEFKPLIPLDIMPFEQHSNGDIDLYIDSIKDVIINNSKYRKLALEDKEDFWNKEKSTMMVSKKWEDFFKKCLGEN